jgi:hypothetical protein
MLFYKKNILTIAVILIAWVLSCTQKREEISYFDTQANINYQKLKEGFYDVPEEAKMRTWWF